MTKQEIAEMVNYIKNLPKASFKNKHGERFDIYSNGVNVFMGGDEVREMVRDDRKIGDIIPLFNNDFGIWSAEELFKLGKALQRVAQKNLEKAE